MFKIFRKKKKETPKVVKFASKYWADEIERPYYFIHNGALKLRRERPNNLSENEVIILEASLTERIQAALEQSQGYITITNNDSIINGALKDAGITIEESYFGGKISMFIEDFEKVYVYKSGMKGAQRKF